ncbi:MAG TPA: type II toxin-antitoxin system HicA family toxin [Acetobacteraceae bacterium]|nr:type II toxin-antitoxin system HicA family toxin [Acetobacteraceae bacterium]
MFAADLRREEWAERQGKASHVVFTKLGHDSVPVPNHRCDIPIGPLRSIC